MTGVRPLCADEQLTEGTLLGGRLRYRQPARGYRTGIEPVLLAAAVPARPGELVLEAGTGAGAGLMCVAARVRNVAGVGVELDPAMARLARDNIAANGLAELRVVTGDVTTVALPSVVHAMANPPWHDRRSTASPEQRRRLAKQEDDTGIEGWIAALARAASGSVTVIIAAGLAARALAAFEAGGLRRTTRLLLPPKEGRVAKLAILQGWRDGSPGAVERVAVLHLPDGRFRPAIDAVLRDGAALALE